MNNLKYLLKVAVLELFGINIYAKTNDPVLKKKYRNQFIILLIGFVSIIYCSSLYSYMMLKSFMAFDAPYLLLSTIMASTSVLVLVSMLRKTTTTLFNFKDYDAIMSLPISTNTIVVSRILGTYISNMLLVILVAIPSGIIYGIVTNPSWIFYIVYFTLMLIVPLIPMIIGTVLGTIVTVIASCFKRINALRTLFTVLLSVGFILVIFVSGDATEIDYYNIAKSLLDSLNHTYPFVQMYTDAIYKLDIIRILEFISISLVSFVGFSYLISKFFKKINTLVTTNRTHSNYQLHALKYKSATRAIIGKEFKRFLSSANYIMNVGIGVILSVIAMIALLIFNADKVGEILQIPELSKMVTNYSPMILCLFVGLTCYTSSSISIEGKNLWIMKTIPVEPKIILLAKVLMNLAITVPAILIDGIILCFIIKPPIINILLIFIVPILFTILVSLVGIIANLHFPNFEWKNEIQIIKQSTPTFIAMIVGMLSSILPLSYLITNQIDGVVGVSVILVAVLIIDTILYLYLTKKGTKMFYKL